MKNPVHFLLFLLSGLVLSGLLFFSSCQDDIQNIPVIGSFVVSPDTVNAGEVALLITMATDADNDEMVYSYQVSAGSISGYGDSVYWLAPLQGGIYNAIVRVTDPAGNQTVDSVKLCVVDSGKSPITGTASFPEGTNFDLSDSKIRLYTSLANRALGVVADSAKAFGFGPIVSFSFPLVEPGSYYLDVWKDMDYSITYSSGDFMGWYGSGDFSNPVLKPVVVQQGVPSQVQVQVNVVP